MLLGAAPAHGRERTDMTQRQEIIERLRAVDLGGGSHESLSAIAKAVYEPAGGWTIGACEQLRQTLVRLLGEADTPTSSGRITDELRKYIRDTARWGISPTCEKGLSDIADRIDAEHNRAIASVMNDALYHANDKDMADLGWYRALDADKEVIHADDELFRKENGEPAGRVTAIGVGQRAGWVWTLIDGRNVSIGHYADVLCHHHAPTVEDVLREFAEGLGVPVADSYIATSAAKLRETLAGDAE